ncbi:lysophospholipid acyltransferase family protein [Amaricoccus solimangrovi]|uniref:1-acyl-sn-glycerol-3-phosphate acyltransferase n=1 Tax=Amaricoccus solimangrovi TaxID=2589815 RepID=A0A501WGQ0_9RHOB|nr:lysophospholipid acyltransferase family protein [Amaricoccus solimangrovi]TPE48548.1 1-acyl-sn-glycerol-3-phosphate acyltransferase [Amaricoccus solimangrovi]
MRAGWNGAPAPVPPPLTLADRARFCWRAPLAFFWLLGCFAVFLPLAFLDRALSRRGDAAGAPAMVRIWARGALRLLGLRAEARGAPMAAPGALVANHSSWLDIVALQSAARVFFVSKAEVGSWPLIGFIGHAIGTEFIERRATEAGRQARALGARLALGDRLCLFPEGTSSDGQRVLPFKSSLFAVFLDGATGPELRVQPVTLRYRPRADLPAALYGWWGEMDFGAHLGSLLARSTGGQVEITFHEPLDPRALGDRKTLSAAAEAATRRGFDA